jgi:hypothetical protein
VALSAGLLATALSEQAAGAVLPAGFVNMTVQVIFAPAGKAAAAGVTGPAAALAKEVLRAMFLGKLYTLATIVLAIGMSGLGAGLWTYHSLAAEQADTKGKKAAGPAYDAKQKDTENKEAAEPAVEHAEESPSVIRVPSRHDGIVRTIGSEIKAGEKLSPKQIITVKLDGEVKKYRRLKKGDTVEEGQLLAQLDDDLARGDVAIQAAKLASAEADQTASEKTRDEAKSRYDTQHKLYFNGVGGIRGTSKEDLGGALLTYNKYIYESISKEEAVKVAKQELNRARKILEMYEIRSPSRGVIKAIYKRPGEAVKALETVFLIQVSEDE